LSPLFALFSPFSLSFALTPHNLHKTVHEVQKRSLDLLIVRSLSTYDMVETNKRECFCESMIFPASKLTVVNILTKRRTRK
jgi:hypothetical protein